MSEHVFCGGYADQYDLLYDKKDYETECDLIEDDFHLYCKGEIDKILPLAVALADTRSLLLRGGMSYPQWIAHLKC